jgi:ribosomal protein S18 acetylase RimI-like enzyme
MQKNLQKLNLDNLEEFKKIRLEALQKEPQAFGDDYENLKNKKENYWRKQLTNKKQVWYGVFDETNLVGIGSIKYAKKRVFTHIAHLSGIYVKPSHRGQGIGRILFEKRVEEAFLNSKVIKLKLIVNINQTNAINLYKSCGFNIVGEMRNEFKIGTVYHNAYLMELIRN